MASTTTNIPICQKVFKLNNGTNIPAVGLGTWQGQSGTDHSEKLRASIGHALRTGYRLIDTAQFYGVENVVGQAVRECGIPREEITVITKFWGSLHDNPAEALRKSLEDSQLEYIDILLMHWPWATTADGTPLMPHESPTIVDTWKKMEALVGPRCRAIGVSNFTPKTLEQLMKETTVVPVVNQVELHAFNPNLRLVPWCQSKGIHVISWSTMGGERHDGGKNEILTHPLFTSIAESHHCSVGVVSLSWAVQRGITVIPKSGSNSRIEDNIKLVQLSESEMNEINSAHIKIKRLRLSDTDPGIQHEMGPEKLKTIMGWTKEDFGWEDAEGNWLL